MSLYVALLVLFLFTINDCFCMSQQFSEGQYLGNTLVSDAAAKAQSGEGKKATPYYQEGLPIKMRINTDEDLIAEVNREAPLNERLEDVNMIHGKREQYKFEKNDPILSRSEELHKDPIKNLNEIEGFDEIQAGDLEECEASVEEYKVTAKREKRYLQYITAGANCDNHGWLSIRVEMIDVPYKAFRDDDMFNNVYLISKQQYDSHEDETYSVNGEPVVLRKTIYQNGLPWIRPDCYLVPSLKQNVLDSTTLIRKLLGGPSTEDIIWGEIGRAVLKVDDLSRNFWVMRGNALAYEEMTDNEEAIMIDLKDSPPTTKSWGGSSITDSWEQTGTYLIRKDNDVNNCAQNLRKRGCTQIGSRCIEQKGHDCIRKKLIFRCPGKVQGRTYRFSGNTAFCLSGDCVSGDFDEDEDMPEALAYLSILNAAREEFDGTKNIKIFKGNPRSCTKMVFGMKNCCVSKGWARGILGGCDGEAKRLAEERAAGKCIYVGIKCDKKFLGQCLRKKQVYCCFGNKFGRLLQEQGSKQIGKTFGDVNSPDCRGFTVEELSRLDFSKLDLTEIIEDVMSNFKPQINEKNVNSHFAKGGELQKLKEKINELPTMKKSTQEASRREGGYMNENMKHMAESAGVMP